MTVAQSVSDVIKHSKLFFSVVSFLLHFSLQSLPANSLYAKCAGTERFFSFLWLSAVLFPFLSRQHFMISQPTSTFHVNNCSPKLKFKALWVFLFFFYWGMFYRRINTLKGKPLKKFSWIVFCVSNGFNFFYNSFTHRYNTSFLPFYVTVHLKYLNVLHFHRLGFPYINFIRFLSIFLQYFMS